MTSSLAANAPTFARPSRAASALAGEALFDRNRTSLPFDTTATIHGLVAAQAARTPDRVALIAGESYLTYREVEARADSLARDLRAMGVGPESLVGVCLERSSDLAIALLGVLRSGGAYVPLDPDYPRERLRFMAEDAGLAAMVTRESLIHLLTGSACPRLLLDRDATGRSPGGDADPLASGRQGVRIAAAVGHPILDRVTADNAAYVIYTSGSTGTPKGVVVTHRNVVSFFVGMDERIPPAVSDPPDPMEPPGLWLAHTSPSFDISVLELFWTLARGYTVVLGGDAARHRPDATTSDVPSTDMSSTDVPAPILTALSSAHGPLAARPRTRELDFSLFYFASNGGQDGGSPADAYRLLLDGARFADRHGFAAVWTPERHFHAFGGLFPNPSVAAAALATITKHVQLRAGSCVLPLHNPIRVAEEWALVDNLSQGRVGISFAAGWRADDFVLAPDKFAERAAVLRRDVEVVRRLWRGESVELPGATGAPVAVSTLPRPVQTELPTWITAAGNPETFRLAGELGCGVLTHLLGQRYEDVGVKVRIYREAWQDAGHAGRGNVALMLHTFVSDDPDGVRDTVRAPLIAYLRDSVDLIEKAAWSFPTFADMAERTGAAPSELFEHGNLGAEERAALLEHAFERYFTTGGLFGMPESCIETLGHVADADVDEIACLIDFGVPTDTVLATLPSLARLMDSWRADAASPLPRQGAGSGVRAFPPPDDSIPALIERHGVTHFQCTPSMASMLVLDARARAALGSLRCMLVGGEALPAPLAADLARLVGGDLLNVYGPTETTIWSATHPVVGDEASVPIGRPIANTTFYVLDEAGQPQPPGVPGELYIGGAGVARGYLNRPELTAERFVPNTFLAERTEGDPTPATVEDPRLYRTGDRVRYGRDGVVEFLGRLDSQVKLRGQRIELGEIEAALRRHPSVHEAVVVLRDDAMGGGTLSAYVTPANGPIDTRDVRSWIGKTLPDIMVPASLTVLPTLPRTPNGKLDRAALPSTATGSSPPQLADGPDGPVPSAFVAPQGSLESQIADVWRSVLGVDQIDVTASFFDLGGHSLLAAHLLYVLRERLGGNIALVDIFRFPTVRALARHLGTGPDDASVRAGRERAEARRDILSRRRSARPSLGR